MSILDHAATLDSGAGLGLTLVELARDIGQRTAAPVADDVDRSARFPSETVVELRRAGLLGALVPSHWGGPGASVSDLADAVSALGEHCASSALVLAMHGIQVACLVRHAGPDTLARVVPGLLAGELLLANAASEVGLGGERRASLCALEAHSDGFRLNKRAATVSYGEYADGVLATARRDPNAPPHEQVFAVCLPPSLSLAPTGEWDTLGLRGTCSRPALLTATLTPDLVIDNYADVFAQTSVPVSAILLSSVWLGIAEAAARRAHATVRNQARKLRGADPGAAPPPSALRLAELAVVLHQARAVVHFAAAEWERVKDTPEVSTLRLLRPHGQRQGLLVDPRHRRRPTSRPDMRDGGLCQQLSIEPGAPHARRGGRPADGQQRSRAAGQCPVAARPQGALMASRVAVLHHPLSFFPFDLAEAVGDSVELLWVFLDSERDADRDTRRLLRRRGPIVEVPAHDPDAAARMLAEHRPEGIVTFVDDNVVLAADLAARLGLTYHSPEVARTLVNKCRQRAALSAAGVPGPRFWTLAPGLTADEVRKAAEAMTYPAVFKPAMGSGSRGILSMAGPQDVCASYRSTIEQIVEEHLEDDPCRDGRFASYLSVESVVSHGHSCHVAITGRFVLASPFRETGTSFRRVSSHPWPKRWFDITDAAIAALGIESGVMHTEIKLTPCGPKLIEVNGRLGGRPPFVLRQVSDVNLFRAACEVAAGRSFTLPGPARCTGVGYWRMLQPPVQARRVRTVAGIDELLSGVLRRQRAARPVSWRRGRLARRHR